MTKLKFTSKIAFSNPIIYSIFIFILVFILVAINNFFYYKSAERNVINDSYQFSKIINTYYENCKKNNTAISECNANIVSLTKTYASTAYYNNSITVEDYNKDTVWKKVSNYSTNIIASDISITLPHDYKDSYIHFTTKTTFSNYQVFASVVKSVTLSIADFIELWFDKKYALQDGVFNYLPEEINSQPSKYRRFKIDNSEYSLLNYYNFVIKDGQHVKKGDVIATGNLHVAIYRFYTSYIYRSGPAIFYLALVIALAYINKRREKQIINEQERIQAQNDKKLLDEFIKQSELEALELSNNTDNTSINNVIQDTVKHFEKYNGFINPPINIDDYEKIFNSEYHEIGVKFRRVIEKLVFDLYQKYIGEKSDILSLNDAIKELFYNKIITPEMYNYLHIIRIYGNDVAHYNENTTKNIEKEKNNIKILNIATSLLSVIEEAVEKLESNQTQISSSQSNKQSFPNARIIKQAEVKNKGV